jgi:zinc and cadmium transporter
VPPLATALGLSLLGSGGGLLLASSLLLFRDNVRTRLVPWLVSYAVGALLGVAFLALLPEALESLPASSVFGTLLAGILGFFVLEKLVLLRHCHTDECHVHTAAAPLIIFGAAHEIPQEVGDTAILLASGYSRRRALVLNLVSGVSGLAGALLAYLAVGWVPALRPYVLAFSSASLIYIAMSDLIPDLHRGRLDSSSSRQVALILAGVVTIVVLERVTG